MLKKLLKSKLVEKYPGALKKLTPKGQELLVDKLAAKVTTEDEIEDFVNGLENTIDVFVDVVVSESDRRVREAGKAPKKDDEPADPAKDDEPADPSKGKTTNQDEVPGWAKELSTTVQALQKELAAEKGKNKMSELIKAAKAQGVPEKYASKYVIGEGYDQEAAVEELVNDWAEMTQQEVNTKLGEGRVVGGKKSGDKEASKEEVDTVLDKIM